MGNFLTKKTKLLDVFIYALALYPLLKFNISSIVLFGLLTFVVLKSYKERSINVSKKRVKVFVLFTLYFFAVVLSVLYSDDKQDAIKKITRLLPLLIVPGILVFCKPHISATQRTRVLNIFLFSNLVFVFILFSIYSVSNELNNFSFIEVLTNYVEFQGVLDQYLGRDMLFIHKAYFSMGFVIVAIFSLQQVFKIFKVNRTSGILYVLSFLFFSFLIFSVFSFPNVIALIISVLIVLIYKVKNRNLNRKAIILIFIIVISSGAGFYYKLNDIDVKRGLNFIESIFTGKTVELNDPRIEVYANVKSIYSKASINEVLFGFGIGDVDSVLNNESEQRLTKYSSKNLLMFSEEFNDDYWHINNIEVLKNRYISPFNTNTAEELKEQVTTEKSSFNISKKIELKTQNKLTFSVYAKQGSANHLILRLGNVQNRASFNLETGTYKTFNNLITAKVTKVGEWLRCSITSEVDERFLLIIGISNDENEYKYVGKNKSLYLWGAQLEEGEIATAYENENTELLKYVSDKQLNSHNNYLYFLLSAGLLGILSFLLALIALFNISFRSKSLYQITFCIIIALNFLTENVLSRHWGLIFVSLMLILFFSTNNKTIEPEIKKSI